MIRALATVWYFLAAAVVSVVMFLAMLIVVGAICLWDREGRSLNSISHLYARLLFWVNPLWSVKVIGRENIDPSKNYVITGNHQSMFDIPIMYFLPLHIRLKWVARKGIYKWPVFGQILWLQHNITVEKESKGATRAEVVHSAKKFFERGKVVLNEGWSVVIFPEGTRSRTGEMGDFEGGAFKLALCIPTEILPVAISGFNGYMKGWRITRRRVVLSILPPISGGNAKTLMERDKEAIKQELERLKDGK